MPPFLSISFIQRISLFRLFLKDSERLKMPLDQHEIQQLGLGSVKFPLVCDVRCLGAQGFMLVYPPLYILYIGKISCRASLSLFSHQGSFLCRSDEATSQLGTGIRPRWCQPYKLVNISPIKYSSYRYTRIHIYIYYSL